MMKKTAHYFFIIIPGICLYTTNLFAQEQTITDEKLWYLDKKFWLIASGVVLIILYGFYRMFKPAKKRVTKTGSSLPPAASETDISQAEITEDTGILENPGEEKTGK